jgi:hypothetical protein
MPNKHGLAMALIGLLFCFMLFASPAFSASSSSQASKVVSLRQAVRFYRNSTWRWQRIVSFQMTYSGHTERQTSNIAYLRWDVRLWQHRNIKARRLAQSPPHFAAWMCIHGGEGSWTAHTGNGYYGGLQMDLTFQRSYGRWLLRTKGTANNWSPLEQIWVAEKAYKSGRGFYPWPNTARACGLI